MSRLANTSLRGLGDAPGVTEIAYPGTVLRAVPSFSCTCPTGWVATEAPGALLVISPASATAAAGDGAGAAGAVGGAGAVGAPVSVEVRIEWVRVPAATRLMDLASANLARRRRSAPDLTVVTQKLGRFGATPAHLSGCAWTVDGDVRAAQLQVVIASPVEAGREVVDALILTGVCAEADAPALVPEFVRIASSLRFHDGSGADAPDRASAMTSMAPVASGASVADDPFTTAAP